MEQSPYMCRFLHFTFRVHPDHLDYVDQVLGACVKKLSGKGKLVDSRATKQIVALLSAPLEKYNNIATALNLSNYPKVMDHLDTATNKVMAVTIIQSIMKNNTCISTADKVEALFELIKGLIQDIDGTPHDELDEEDYKEEQYSVVRLIHMLHNDDHEEMLKLVRRLQSLDGDVAGEEVPATPKKIFQILHQGPPLPKVSLEDCKCRSTDGQCNTG